VKSIATIGRDITRRV